MHSLVEKYKGDKERVGFVLRTGDAVEVPNISKTPEEGFSISTEDIIKYLDPEVSIATWHTHPGQSSNLSVEDMENFLQWPDHLHYIIGVDGISCYKVVDGRVVPVG
jgi:proteasome lid subunit RPN8/RPN11